MSRYIDADAAQNAIRKLYTLARTEREGNLLAYARQNVRDLPAANVEQVRHGEWQNDDDTGECLARGSVCREVYDSEVTPEEFAMFYHYCPNCGAKMDAQNGRAPSPSYHIPAPPQDGEPEREQTEANELIVVGEIVGAIESQRTRRELDFEKPAFVEIIDPVVRLTIKPNKETSEFLRLRDGSRKETTIVKLTREQMEQIKEILEAEDG